MEDEIIEVMEENGEILQEETIEENYEDASLELEEEQQEIYSDQENNLLIEYIKQELLNNVNEDLEENVEDVDNTNGDDIRDGVDIEPITILLNDIYDEVSIQTGYIEEYNRNNNLQSDINDISLSNMLLILVFIGVLFTALLNFSRRIF